MAEKEKDCRVENFLQKPFPLTREGTETQGFDKGRKKKKPFRRTQKKTRQLKESAGILPSVRFKNFFFCLLLSARGGTRWSLPPKKGAEVLLCRDGLSRLGNPK